MARAGAAFALLAALCGGAAADRVSVVLIGATGNLAEKYLWQGLYNIHASGLRAGDSMFIYPAANEAAGTAAPTLTRIWADNITSADAAKKDGFLSRVAEYAQLRSSADYEKLGQAMDETVKASDEEEAGRLIYLSVPPKFFGPICADVHKFLRPRKGWLRVIVEKPFGVDHLSATKLAEELFVSLKSEEILLVDHYMGKATMAGMRAFGRANPAYHGTSDPSGTPPGIRYIEVGMLETVDVKGRTGFYDGIGVLRDTMQNHLMMMLAQVCMDRTDSSHEEADARLAFFTKLRTDPEMPMHPVLLGQYRSYNEHVNEDLATWGEKPRDAPSNTLTYAHVVTRLKSNASGGSQTGWWPLRALGWGSAEDTPKSTAFGVCDNINIHLLSGKAQDISRSYVEVHYKDGTATVFNLQGPVFPKDRDSSNPRNYDYSLKGAVIASSGPKFVVPHGWSSQESEWGQVAVAPDAPFAYEVLLRAGLEGDREHFVRIDEVVEAWRVWDRLLADDVAGTLGRQIHLYDHGAALYRHDVFDVNTTCATDEFIFQELFSRYDSTMDSHMVRDWAHRHTRES